MKPKVIETQGDPLTEADFLNDLPAPGSSDKRYSAETLALMDEIVAGAKKSKKEKES